MTLNVSNHNGRLLADHFLDLHIIQRALLNNNLVFNRNLTLIDHVSTDTTGVQDGYAHTSRHT